MTEGKNGDVKVGEIEPVNRSTWRMSTLDQIGRIITGKTPSSRNSDYFGGDIPFVTPRDFNGRRRIQSTERHLTEKGSNTVKGALIPSNAVMVSCIGSDMGKAAMAADPCVTNQQINSTVVDSDNDALFVYYNLSNRKGEIRGSAGGSAQPILNKSGFGQLSILLPSLHEQRAIAHVLGTLDDKIELNRRMNETLEEMARALFKSWFVDFDPVRAKMEGRWQRGESLPGLPADLYDLFPDRLAPSELGVIPEGWEVKALGECFNLTMGQSPPGSTYNEQGDGLPFFQGNADFGFRYPERRKYCTAPTRIARPDDTLVSVRAPVGEINMAWEQCCIGRGVSALRHKSGSRSFTYYCLRALQPTLVEYEHSGTVFGAINKRQFEALLVIDSPKALVAFFEIHSREWEDRIRSNTLEGRALAAQRDALLPKLVSGVVGVGELIYAIE